MITCPRCNVAYPVGASHECVPQRAGARVPWPFQLATGIALMIVGVLAASMWIVLTLGGYFLALFSILCFGSGVWVVVKGWAARQTQMVTCPRCDVAYPEGKPHECHPQQATSPWRQVLWPFLVAAGLVLLTFGLVEASVWISHKPPRPGSSLELMFLLVAMTGYLLRIPPQVFTVLCLGFAVGILVTAWVKRPWK